MGVNVPVDNVLSRLPNFKGGIQSGQTKEQEIAELERRLSKLRHPEPQGRNERPLPSQAKRIVQQNILDATSRCFTSSANTGEPAKSMTPGRTRPGEFLEQAIRDTARGGGTPPSDSSSSSSSSDHDSELDSGGDAVKHHKKSTKNKRRMPHRMLLKPIPPTKYDGSADATLFYRWCRESTSFVRVGRVPASDQLFFLSYYLTGKALDFYEQVVIWKPVTYTLEDFFLDLFDFCFPADFRNKMWD
jgi:hypothetical protein